jgi:hypothetical protein
MMARTGNSRSEHALGAGALGLVAGDDPLPAGGEEPDLTGNRPVIVWQGPDLRVGGEADERHQEPRMMMS